MSRWDDRYREFEAEWEQAKKSALRVKAKRGLTAAQRANVLRLKRVVTYVDDLQKSGLKDVMPYDAIDEAAGASHDAFNLMERCHDEENIDLVEEVNGQLDRILSAICPFVVNNKNAAVAVGHAFKVLRDDVQKYTKEFEDHSGNLVSDIKTWHEDISIKYKEIGDAHTRVVVDDEDEDQKSMKTELNECYNQIIKFYRELLKGFKDEENEEDNQDSIKAEITSAKDDILMEKSVIENETADLKVFHDQVFGTKNKEGEREGGLKYEIETRQKNLDEYKEEQQKIIGTLKEQIDGLLPGATSAGLATAFKELKEASEEAIKKYTKYFYWSLGGLFFIAGLSLIPELCYISPDIFTYFNISWACDKPATNNLFLVWVRGLLAKSLLIAPALWFAVFTNKRRSEHQRLQQEYAHKEAVSKSFDGYKKQIQELGTDDATLLTELLEAAIKAIGYNASATLGGKHGEGPPITEAARYVGMGKKQ